MKRREYIIGIDEAGRGPLAGPVSVGAVRVPDTFDFTLLDGVRDSKQLSAKARDRWYEKLVQMQQEEFLRFSVSFASAETIDNKGIVAAIKGALSQCLKNLDADPEVSEILLDGSLFAPREYVHQKTIIRGDSTEPLISLASIAAKVERDRKMEKFSKIYPAYNFHVHKGYGTLRHRQMIQANGLCALHRTTFCKNLIRSAHAV